MQGAVVLAIAAVVEALADRLSRGARHWARSWRGVRRRLRF